MSFRITSLAAVLACVSTASIAQQLGPIERVKITDNEMSCAQMLTETAEMDKIVAAAAEAQSSGNNTAMAGTAANVAAEVAGRTGLFGQIGGLAGHFFGQAATQAAAGAAKQSGQQTAAQAAERAKQASARKEYVAGLFTARGCKASDPSYNPPATAQSAAAVAALQQQAQPAAAKAVDPAALQKLFAPAETITALPEADPDSHFKGQMGGTFGKSIAQVMPNSRRVAVMGFRVAFITENTATATVRAAYLPGRDMSGASSTLNLKLSGVDQAVMQSITDKAYADLLAQLRFAGREVVPQEELKEFFSGVEVSPTPYVKSSNGQSAVVMAPTGMPLWFNNWDGQWGDKSPFQQANHKRVGEYSGKLKAIAISPLIVVNFARMSSSGNQSGLMSRSAETGAALSMHVGAFSSTWVRTDEFRNGMVMGGDEGAFSMQAPIASTLEFGTMKEVDSSNNAAAKGIFDTLGKSMGMLNAGGANRSKSESVAETNSQAYAAAAVDALGRATGTLAKWFQKYPAK